MTASGATAARPIWSGADRRRERLEIGTLLPFAWGVSNGGSFQKPTFNVRSTGISERQKLGRQKTGRFQLTDPR